MIQTDRYALHPGDCLEVMRGIPDQSIDLILCDLPYGTTGCKWDSIIPLDLLWSQYRRVLSPLGVIALTCSQPFTTTLISSNLAWFKYCWVWEKSKGSNIMHAKYQPLKVHEDVAIFASAPSAQNSSKRNMIYNPQKVAGKPYDKGMQVKRSGVLSKGCNAPVPRVNDTGDRYPRSVVYFRTAESEGRIHPTQKPVALMDYLVRTYSNPSDVVLDNCMGSGTTGVAAIQSGRRFIGIEKDDGYFEIARDRITAATNADVGLFAHAAE